MRCGCGRWRARRLSAALELAQRGLHVVLLEAKEVAWGASGRNGGQAIHGLACDQETIESQLGLDDAKRVWAMSLEALDLIRERIATRFRIDCDWRDGYLGRGHQPPARPRELAGAAPTAWHGAYGLSAAHASAQADVGRSGSPARGTWAAVHDPRTRATCTR
jgi:glycine/D-amino acid oxidase-like deaminating enzyme